MEKPKSSDSKFSPFSILLVLAIIIGFPMIFFSLLFGIWLGVLGLVFSLTGLFFFALHPQSRFLQEWAEQEKY